MSLRPTSPPTSTLSAFVNLDTRRQQNSRLLLCAAEVLHKQAVSLFQAKACVPSICISMYVCACCTRIRARGVT
jgi:hypothetical protein